MLTAADRELIAAAVDGGLTPVQDSAFRFLLATSPEAVALFDALQADASRLRSMARVAAPAALAPAVMARIVPVTTPAITPRRRTARVLPYAVAASLLVAMTAGSMWFAMRQGGQADAIAVRKSLPGPTDRGVSVVVPAVVVRETLPSPRDTGTAVAHAPELIPTPSLPATELAPSPRAALADVVAAGPLAEVRPFETVESRLPFLAPVADLDRTDVRTKMLADLATDPAYRLDLFTRDTFKAAELFQIAAKTAGVTVTVEGVAADRMQKKAPSAWAVYSEVLTPADIAGVLGQLAKLTRADKATPFGTAHLIPAQAAEQREVRTLLGVDPGVSKRVKPDADPKPLAATTADQVASALTRPAGEKPALLLVYLPQNARANPLVSKDVRTFLDRRGPRQPAAVPLLVVIRPAD